MRRFSTYTAIACVGALGLMTSFEAPTSLNEVPDVVAAELIGGADCSDWKSGPCPKASEATSDCPESNVFMAGSYYKDYAGSGEEWCGCSQSCNGEKHTKGIYKCGSGGGGPMVFISRAPRTIALIR